MYDINPFKGKIMYIPIDDSNELNLVSDIVTLDIKKIPGTIGYYASRCGKIFGTDKQDILYELKTYLNNNGYLGVSLRSTRVTDKDLINHKAMAHRLIAITFVEGYKKGLVVDHIDRNRLNNHADNLRWVDSSANNTGTVRSYKSSMVRLVFKCYCRNIYTGEIKEFDSRSKVHEFLGFSTNKRRLPDHLLFKTQRGQLFNNEWEVSLFKDQWDYIDISEPKKPGFCTIIIRDKKGSLIDKMFNKQDLYYKYKLWNPHLEAGSNLIEKYITKFNLLYPDLTIEYDDKPKPSHEDILEKIDSEEYKILLRRARRNNAEAIKEPKRRGRSPIVRERIKVFKNLINKEVIQMENIETGETKQYKSFRETSREVGICRKQLQSIIDTDKIYKKKYTFKKCASPK